jgi:cytochrome b561
LLHALVALAVVFQLCVSLVMTVPKPRHILTPLGTALFTAHHYVGLAAMLVVALFWAWLLVRRGGTPLGRLFPWLSRRRLTDVLDAVLLYGRLALRLRLPDPEAAEALPAAIQGLGLVLVLIVASTGTIGYLGWIPGTAMTGTSWLAFEIHETLANVLWGYLAIHVGAVLLHELFGHRLLRQMTPLPEPDRPAAHARQ